MKILNGKVKGNRKKIGTKYGPVVSRSKTCLHPHRVCRKLPLTLKHTKKNCRPSAAQVITNCAFIPTDADTANIHVQVWKGPAEAWMRSIDRDFAAAVGPHSTIYKNAMCLLLNGAVCDRGLLVQPKLLYHFIKTFQ